MPRTRSRRRLSHRSFSANYLRANFRSPTSPYLKNLLSPKPQMRKTRSTLSLHLQKPLQRVHRVRQKPLPIPRLPTRLRQPKSNPLKLSPIVLLLQLWLRLPRPRRNLINLKHLSLWIPRYSPNSPNYHLSRPRQSNSKRASQPKMQSQSTLKKSSSIPQRLSPPMRAMTLHLSYPWTSQPQARPKWPK